VPVTAADAALAGHLAGGRASAAGGRDRELGELLAALGAAARVLAREVQRAALAGHLGFAGGRNVTGDAQKKLDVLGHETVVGALRDTGLVAAVVSEERGEPQPLAGPPGRYVVCIDPLDGSSNTDVNGAVGTIFGVWRRRRPGPVDPGADLLRPGREQALAGYVMYGPATVLVYTAGQGSHGFTLDPERGAWVLTHPGIRCPARGPYYSANLARYADWPAGVRRFADLLAAPAPPAAAAEAPRPSSLRYTGALVADLHRSLVEGGIYFYPADRAHREGKLRLLYECAPLAFIAEQAGGAATTGREPVLDVRPVAVHQRVPLAIGSAGDVALYARHAEVDGAGDGGAGRGQGGHGSAPVSGA
jgi:fructose-1,6-bisphosphatase I